MEVLTRGRDGVLRDGAVFHVTWKVPMAIDGDGPQAGAEMQGQGASCGHVSDAGVGHHGSVAVRVTAATSFPLEVQSKCPPTP